MHVSLIFLPRMSLLSVPTQVAPPSPTDWAIIRRYSHRIKELRFFPVDRVSVSFLQAISLQPFLLCPNLRLLFWYSSTEVVPISLSITLLRCLLGPSLVSLDICALGMKDAAFQPLLTNLLLPNVKSLAIAGQRAPSGSLSLPSTLCDRLERLYLLYPIDDAALRHVTMSPKLKNLSLALNLDQSRLYQVRLPSNSIPFYNVGKLSLELLDLQFVTSLL